MRLRRFVWLLLSLSLSLVTVFSVGSIDAFAALTGGKFLTASESLQIFGSSIDFQYFNGTDYSSASFAYDSTATVTDTYGDMPTYIADISGSAVYLKYTAAVSGLSANVNYITVDIQPMYSIFDTEQLTTCIALSNSSNYISTTYQSPAWDWYIGGSVNHFENDLVYNTSYHSILRFNNTRATFVPVQYFSQSSLSAYSQRATFSGNQPSDGVLTLFIMCPYVSATADGSNGTFTQTSGTGDINVDVNIDMSETNSLLEDVKDAISGIWSGITGVFVPSDEFFDDWKDDISEALDDSFGRYSEVDDLLDDVKDSIVGAAPSSDISLPAVSIPNGISISAQTWHVVPSGWSDIIDYIKFGFDIFFTCLFVNTVRQRLRTIIHGETLVEVEGVD